MATNCPWAKVSNETSTSLQDVMSEQLASDIEAKENGRTKEGPKAMSDEEMAKLLNEDTSDDLVIAQMLQMQFDKEYDQALGVEETHRNGGSKVTVSLSKYKLVPENPIWDDSDDDDETLAAYLALDEDKRHIDCYETAEKEPSNQLPKCGFKKVGDSFVTKHDRELSERNNGKRIMEFPPGIETGDGGGCDLQLSNAVYNKIRNFSIKEGKRKARIGDKVDKSTTDQAIDPKTKVILFKMINGGVLDGINGVISTGKEAVILHADGGPGPDEAETPCNIPKEVAIKVFKTTLNEFKTRDKYIKDDYRFRDRFSKQNPRKIIHMWAEKELHNLSKMLKHGVNVPEPILLKKHVLVMSFVGDEGSPAPKLKDANLDSAQWQIAYEDVVKTMKVLYNQCSLVHADLSEYNILWHNNECHYIDCSQSVEPNHPHGLEFLLRDCRNISEFFAKKGVYDCAATEELFSDITGLALEKGANEAELLIQVRDYERNQEILSGVTDNCEEDDPSVLAHTNFDYFWEQSQRAAGNSEARNIPIIPGHSRNRGKSKSKSSLPKSPSSSSLGKSPKSPKSPSSSHGLASMSDEALKALKDSMVSQELELDLEISKKASVVKFQDE